MENPTGDIFSFKAAILDMDGVITRTAVLHARAWKQMFDELLERLKGENFIPLDIDDDYNRLIDGIPRHDGIRNFLRSRNIELPEGHPGDPPEKDTVYGLGNRKNKLFLTILKEEGVEVYEDAIRVIRLWKDAGIKLAVISSSRNCRHIIETAGISGLFDARVDGQTLAEENMKGKPEPDMFLRAGELLGIHVKQTIVIEDAIFGIEAGKKGNFGLVIGVARDKDENVLKDAGADIVVKDLSELVNDSGHLKVSEISTDYRR
jgi:trehalose 6-phosphate phosphatase